MFKLSVTAVKPLTDLIALINVIQTEAVFRLDPEKLCFRMMDASRVAMLNLEVPKEFFDAEYVVPEQTVLTVNVTELLRLLKRAGKDDKATLTLLGNGKLELCFNGRCERKFTVPTLESTVEECPPLPKVDFKVKAALVASVLNSSFEDAGLVSDHVHVEAENIEKLVLTADGDLMGATITLQKGSADLLSLTVEAPSKAVFSLNYLREIVKAAEALADIVNLEYSTDMPLKLDFVNQQCKIEFYLAPRLQVD
jgi:proliferating cell nuclear antigen